MARKPADQSVNPQAILIAAADVLKRNGFEATTMKDIAAEVNLTAASLYHHFRNKDMLLLAVLEAGLETVISRLEPIVHAAKPASQKLHEMVCVHVMSLTENTAVGAAMVFEIHTLMNHRHSAAADPEFIERRDLFFARRDYFEKLYRSVIQEGIDQGAFQPIDTGIFTKTLLGANNWLGVWYREGGRLSGAQIAGIMAEVFIRALRPLK